MNVLFVTWDGPQSTYLESLFIPIFKALESFGLNFHVLQFTWGDKSEPQTSSAFKDFNIPYRRVLVWRKPISLGSFLTATYGAVAVSAAVMDWKINIVMPRGILCGMAVLLSKKFSKFDVLFDADGLPADERVDFSGQSSIGLTYRFMRDIEAQVVRVSRSVITRSQAACEILLARAGAGTAVSKFFVVSNARDELCFTPLSKSARAKVRESLGVYGNDPLIIYVGSLGEKYLIDEMLNLFSIIKLKSIDAHFLIVTTTPDYAKEALLGFPDSSAAVRIIQASPEDVPSLIGAADLGLALIKQSFSMKAASAIKVGEYLLCGVPVIVTAGIGDSEKLSADAVFVLHDLRNESIGMAVNWFLCDVFPNQDEFSQTARQEGLQKYALKNCVAGYLKAFSSFS